jgi:hypothetical protein
MHNTVEMFQWNNKMPKWLKGYSKIAFSQLSDLGHRVTSEEDANEVQDKDGDTDVYIHTINNFHQY